MPFAKVLNLENWIPYCPGMGHQSEESWAASMQQGGSLLEAGPFQRAVAATVNTFPLISYSLFLKNSKGSD